jgi:hypothetical protein
MISELFELFVEIQQKKNYIFSIETSNVSFEIQTN